MTRISEIRPSGGGGGFTPDVAAPANGELLLYDETAGGWVNYNSLNQLLSSGQPGDVLQKVIGGVRWTSVLDGNEFSAGDIANRLQLIPVVAGGGGGGGGALSISADFEFDGTLSSSADFDFPLLVGTSPNFDFDGVLASSASFDF